jgi:uncharacterized protein (TIGR02001 family)
MAERAAVALLMLTSAAVTTPSILAAELSAYGTLTTEYIYRGLSISDRNPAVQIGVDYEHGNNVFVGAWFSTIDLSTSMGRRDFESNYYLGYHHEVAPSWGATLTLLRYAYPGAGGTHSYDHNEALLEISFNDNYAAEYAYTDDVYGLGRRASHLQLSGDWPLGAGWMLGASIGRNDLSSIGIPEYFHGDIGLSARYSRFAFDLRLYADEPVNSRRFDSASAGTRFVFSISAAL